MKKHIDLKDNGDEISKDIAVEFEKAKDTISGLSRNLLLTKLSVQPKEWYKFQIANLKAFDKKSRLIIGKAYKNVSKALNGTDNEIINNKQVKSTLKALKKGFNQLHTDAINQHKQSYTMIYQQVIHSNVSDKLYNMVMQRVQQNANLGYHVTQSGKTYHWESWMEMKIRTDIQSDIAENMTIAGDEGGVVFYTTSCYGNCAPDHADYQGKIYVTDNWESVAPKDKKEAISDYIKVHKVKTVQEVTTGEPWLTTRPNCRHYFMPMAIDEVLECSTSKDVEKLRDKYELNFAGKYKPEKYDAMQKQRYLERRIRKYDEGVAVGKDLLSKAKTEEEKIKANNIISDQRQKLNAKRKEINTLVENTDGLVRAYQREKYNKNRGF